MYKKAQTHAPPSRSLWRVEPIRGKWQAGFVGFSAPFRLCHITSGYYLSASGDPSDGGRVHLRPRHRADLESTSFELLASKDDRKAHEEREQERKEEEGMGVPMTKYGDSIVLVLHSASGMWLSYHTTEEQHRGVGKVQTKTAALAADGHMDDGLSFARAQVEESRSARVIRKCKALFQQFNQ